MGILRTSVACVLITLSASTPLGAQKPAAPDAAAIVGVWELQSAKDMKSDQIWVDSRNAIWRFQFSRTYWTALQTLRDRKVIPPAEYARLSAADKLKVDHARVWNDEGQQVFAARGGTWRLEGDALHHIANIALYTDIIGADRVLRIVRLDKDTLVVRTEFPDVPDVSNDWTFRRIE